MKPSRALRAASFGVLLIGVSGLFSGCAPSAASAPTSGIDRGKCGDFELDVERFWSSKTKGEVKAGILKVGGDFTEQTSERVVTKMDNLTRDWVMMQEGVCKDTLVREVMPREAYVKVSLCLRSSLIAQRTMVETLKYATKEHLLSVDSALTQVQTDSAACQQEAIYSAYNEGSEDTAAEQAREKMAQAGVYRELNDGRAEAAALAASEAAERTQSIRVKVDALIDQASQASFIGRTAEIMQIGQQALQLAERDGYVIGIARAKGLLGYAYESQDDYPRALQMRQQALAIYRQVLGEQNPETAQAYEDIAMLYSGHNDFPNGLQMFRRALAIQRKVLGDNDSEVAATYNRMGSMYSQQQDYPSALEMLKNALAIYRVQNDPPDPFNVKLDLLFISDLCEAGYQPACNPQ